MYTIFFYIKHIYIACNKNHTDQTSLILSHAIACICTLSQKCAALLQCDNCHNQSQTCNKTHHKWNMAASGWALDHGRDMYKCAPPTLRYSGQLW